MASRAELLKLGLSEGQIHHRARDGRLVRRYRGVYVIGPGALTDRGEWLAAALFAAPDGVVSHRDAACILDLVEGGAGELIDITCSRRISPPAGLRAHRAHLPKEERHARFGIPVTSTGRTILDCAAAGAAPREIERMLNAAFMKGLPVKPSLGALLTQYPGARGVKTLREAVRRFSGGPTPTKSDLEEDYLDFLDRHRFPRPLLNHWLETHIGRIQVDCCWPEEGLVIEIDAPSTHGARPSMLDDRRRDRALILAGWTPGRVMEEDLEDEEALANELVALLARSVDMRPRLA